MLLSLFHRKDWLARNCTKRDYCWIALMHADNQFSRFSWLVFNEEQAATVIVCFHGFATGQGGGIHT